MVNGLMCRKIVILKCRGSGTHGIRFLLFLITVGNKRLYGKLIVEKPAKEPVTCVDPIEVKGALRKSGFCLGVSGIVFSEETLRCLPLS